MIQKSNHFLTAQSSVCSNPSTTCTENSFSENGLHAVSCFLSILKVQGDDAATFLQGQLTCNIKELTEKNSFFAGFCNAKGRVISTLLILKHQHDFLIILPSVLLEKVKNKLKMYVLRAKVQLHTVDEDDLRLTGLHCSKAMARDLALPETDFSQQNGFLKLPNAHYLWIGNLEETQHFWTEKLATGFELQTWQDWQILEMNAGLAWLDEKSSEEYIPQMLNLDKLGGISFNKGCYTGQEVVARTHYLGKTKRELFLAQVVAEAELTKDCNILDETGQSVGQVLSFVCEAKVYKMLLVLQSSATESRELRLNSANQDKITLIPFATA